MFSKLLKKGVPKITDALLKSKELSPQIFSLFKILLFAVYSLFFCTNI